MINSIRDALSVNDAISEISLIVSYDNNKVCVVVEGKDDQKLFRPLLASNVEIFETYSACNGVDIILQTSKLKNKRVIGIRDKDYLEKPINERCFFSDYCCAEMMIISIDDCFDRLYSNFYLGNDKKSDELRFYCLQRLEKLSKIRKANYDFGWNMSFRSVNPLSFYDKDVCEMNKKLLSLINRSNNNFIDAERERICENIIKCENLDDYLMITNGHDFVKLFLKTILEKNKNISKESISSSMRATFGLESFKKTNLFKKLLAYQENNHIAILNKL